MANGTSKIIMTTWPLPSRVWKKGQKHPYPNRQHVTMIKHGGLVSGISFRQISELYGEWREKGLKRIEPRLLTMDAKCGTHNYSAELNLSDLHIPGKEMMEKKGVNPFNTSFVMSRVVWFIHIFGALKTGILKPDKPTQDTLIDIQKISSGTVVTEPVPEGSFRMGKFICQFDWVDVFNLIALYKVAKETGRLEEYKNVEGQLRAASELSIAFLDSVYEADHILGVDVSLGHKPINAVVKEVKPFMPDLLKWANEGKISLEDALSQLGSKYPKPRLETFAKIKAACESPSTENTKVDNGGN